ncbi:alcohol dehydrogenase [Actinopolyspora mzabensis]|uniref:Alcohol dehydrogenase n=1 Tax=Actinopolyspora mzabensis TaxID=995066 RepID=A0A1G9A3Z0_ACTMZ|nr:iron-containing alcohol dehydrogenase [Actinopolyspora mzabensis]SDK21120.1 alcohol dehydrogenase [Actinopolyspora mzabensis]
MKLDHFTPTRVVFGAGRLREVGQLTREHGSRALIVCGRRAARQHGMLHVVRSSLGEAGLAVTVFDEVSPDPRADEVDQAVAVAHREGCDVLVGLGGGSAIDAAKAAAVGFVHGPAGALLGTTVAATDDLLPVVAVPTTAGSGAEVTKGAIITDTDRGLKTGIRGEALFPAAALIDPDLLRSVPHQVLVETGFDAFAHAVESYLARRSNPLSDLLAERCLELISGSLPRLVRGERDAELRETMALAALFGGLNVATASTCLPHRLQQAMGAIPKAAVSHGRGLALVYPAWLRHAYPHASRRMDNIAELLGRGGEGPDAIVEMLDRIGLRARLTTAGVSEDDLPILVGSVTGNTDNDPIPGVTGDLIGRIYEESL